ncbi:hypothetical protein [Paracoccus onubensis]|uniref:Uncharacterized protein n=1 Tax=Paracoccus onubensis TaxID=1675788 RepID=A0A418T1M4_9RHOB|nr:hypothetical protein [Paracoccus onubensis]RJE87105.1 hypothetical protein D3P04_04965 [Paracoccus onubensis]
MQASDLLQLATAFAGHRNLSLNTVAVYAANDGKFFMRIDAGGGCTLRTARKILSWFSDNWPSDLEWPRSIPRPQKSKDAA